MNGPTTRQLNNNNNNSQDNVASSDEEYLSDYIQRHTVPLPHISQNSDDDVGDRDDDDFSNDTDCRSVRSNGTDRDWQENWLFKKKKSKTETCPSPIAMLVPSPTEEVKTLIGDLTTDEVSDLSEAGSDVESELTDESQGDNAHSSLDIPRVLVGSKTIIGGKNEVETFEESAVTADLLQPDSLVSMQSLQASSPIIMEAKNNLILVNLNDKPVTASTAAAADEDASKSVLNETDDNKVNLMKNVNIDDDSKKNYNLRLKIMNNVDEEIKHIVNDAIEEILDEATKNVILQSAGCDNDEGTMKIEEDFKSAMELNDLKIDGDTGYMLVLDFIDKAQPVPAPR